jgi:hypothetical protein
LIKLEKTRTISSKRSLGIYVFSCYTFVFCCSSPVSNGFNCLYLWKLNHWVPLKPVNMFITSSELHAWSSYTEELCRYYFRFCMSWSYSRSIFSKSNIYRCTHAQIQIKQNKNEHLSWYWMLWITLNQEPEIIPHTWNNNQAILISYIS